MEQLEVLSKDSVNVQDKEVLYLVFNLCSQWFCVDALKVREIIKVPLITKLPNQPEAIRGLIRLREKVIPVVDSRFQLSMETMQDEKNSLVNMLKEREQDHINYINELVNCVETGRDFTLTTDPTKCRFGKWYLNFKTDNLVLADFLERFEVPHMEIHHTAQQIVNYIKAGDMNTALQLLEKAKGTTLNNLLEMFSELYQKVDSLNREFAILYERSNDVLAFSVDKVHQIMRIKQSEIKPLPNYSSSKFSEGVFQTEVGMCIILNEKFLTEGIGDISGLLNEV